MPKTPCMRGGKSKKPKIRTRRRKRTMRGGFSLSSILGLDKPAQGESPNNDVANNADDAIKPVAPTEQQAAPVASNGQQGAPAEPPKKSFYESLKFWGGRKSRRPKK